MVSYETHNLDQYLCYKSQMISNLVFFIRTSVANVGTDSLYAHVYLNDYDKSILKELKPFYVHVLRIGQYCFSLHYAAFGHSWNI